MPESKSIRVDLQTPSGGRAFLLTGDTLGSGGFGTVKRAHDEFGTEFALKLVALPADSTARDALIERFDREARTLAAVRHPNVVRFITYGVATDLELEGLRGYLGLVMDLVEGTPVRGLIGDGFGAPPDMVRDLARQLCAGLSALSTAHPRIVHRDIKPANLVIGASDRRLRIVDFGLGQESSGKGTVVQTSSSGTPRYMAPEQFESASTLGPSTDLYAAALTLYECLAGQVPLVAADATSIYARRRSGDGPAPLPGLLRALDPFFGKALAASPADRFDDALRFWEAFDQAADAAGLAEAPIAAVVHERAEEVPKRPAPEGWEDLQSLFARAIDLETRAVRDQLRERGADTPIAGKNGVRIDLLPDEARYRCQLAEGLAIAEETPLVAHIEGKRIRGRVSGSQPDRKRIEFWLQEDVGESFRVAHLTFDATFLLEELKKQVLELPNDWADLDAGMAILSGDVTTGDALLAVDLGDALNPSQTAAIRRALGSSGCYIWGPPGTGKTRTLGYFLLDLLHRGDRAVVVAPTNVAVDNAVRALGAAADAKVREVRGQGRLVRVGDTSWDLRRAGYHIENAFEHTAREQFSAAVLEIESLWRRHLESEAGSASGASSSALPESLRGRYYFARGSLQRYIATHQPAPPALQRLLQTVVELGETVREIDKAAVTRASLVFTTLTRLHLPGIMEKQRFDRVIVDEVSMAPLPTVLVAGTRARSSITVAGDFLQLPAVHISSRSEVLETFGTDVFARAELTNVQAEHLSRPMLQEQYRMHPEISWIVSALFYSGRLRDAAPIREAYPGPYAGERLRNALCLLDTTESYAISETTEGGSRRNETHAAYVARIAALLAEAGHQDVGIIAPYTGQVRAIRDAIGHVERSILKSVEVSTIHRFQGREKEVLILDLTDAPPVPPVFLNERRNRSAPRILNVGISRARRYLLVLAHRDYMQGQLGFRSLASTLFARLCERGMELDVHPWPEGDLLEFFGISDTQPPLPLIES